MTGKALTMPALAAKPEPVAIEDRLRRDASQGVSGHLIGSLANVATLVQRFTSEEWWKGNSPLKGTSVLVAGAGNRGLMLSAVRPARRVAESRFTGSDVPPGATLDHPNATRWLQAELEALASYADVKALPVAVFIEPSAVGDLSREARQRLDRLASECGCVVAVVVEAECDDVIWRPGLFDLPEGLAA